MSKNSAFTLKSLEKGVLVRALKHALDRFSSGAPSNFEVHRTIRSDGSSVREQITLTDLEYQTELSGTSLELMVHAGDGGFSLQIQDFGGCMSVDVQGPDSATVDLVLRDLQQNLGAESIGTLSDLFFKRSKEGRRVESVRPDLISPTRIDELRSLSSKNFDFAKLIRLCEEININYAEKCYLGTAALTRALLDHVPPLFRVNSFAQLANYPGGKSFKDTMDHLDQCAKKIADGLLHTQIRRKEVLPTAQQVDFSNGLDVLLAEIVRMSRSS